MFSKKKAQVKTKWHRIEYERTCRRQLHTFSSQEISQEKGVSYKHELLTPGVPEWPRILLTHTHHCHNHNLKGETLRWSVQPCTTRATGVAEQTQGLKRLAGAPRAYRGRNQWETNSCDPRESCWGAPGRLIWKRTWLELGVVSSSPKLSVEIT